MVEHNVTIEHEFKTANGSVVAVHVSQEENSIEINYRLAGDTSTVRLDPEDLEQLAELFRMVADQFSPKPLPDGVDKAQNRS